ncbi:uncharacterized protein MELLADRAFT_71693 [Melampsora larici-populina 98AG31]|uniref:Uncharacterized protein n=1 Tax=Melampsora larici-populina (strain 98AG31 / pathotype 3-4-7) TaxID=747676 RepID=F4RJJ4_MELLP|nr:uncharacterized protein MELLADRAFT_71693 [Melampsora larici-populina 98AG31]EGG07480.1 hypothetical protein MELLADRAFT_71693 [Melampsora larici-populina 98AG31]
MSSHSHSHSQLKSHQQSSSSSQLQSDLTSSTNSNTTSPSQPQPLPPKPTRSQLKNQSRVLDSFLPSSQKVNIAQFAKQTYQLIKPSKDFDLNDWSTDLPSNQLDSLVRSFFSISPLH